MVDLDAYLSSSTPADVKRAECAKVAECLHKYGVLVVRDSRTSEKDNNDFIDLMEGYFEQDKKTKLLDSRPEIGFQVGSTPEGTEKARDHCSRFLKGFNRPVSLCPPERGVKWRFFYRIGEQSGVHSGQQLVPVDMPCLFQKA